MSILAKLTDEQIAAFAGCKTKEEILAKAKELGFEPTEEELDEAVKLVSGKAESGELDDEALDAVAGGKEEDPYNKDGYIEVKKKTECTIGRYEMLPEELWRFNFVPKKNGYGKCGSCANCKEVNNNTVCVLQRKGV